MTNIKRSIVFIDAGNLSSAWLDRCKKQGCVSYDKNGKRFFTKKLDYKQLLCRIAEHTDLIRGYYFDAAPEQLGKKQRFYDLLRATEITIRTKKLRHKAITCRSCGNTQTNIPYQKGVDVSLVTELMSLCFENAYDIAILVSGDNDFEDALNYVKSRGKKVWVASFADCLGEDVMRVADRIIKLDDLFDELTVK